MVEQTKAKERARKSVYISYLTPRIIDIDLFHRSKGKVIICIWPPFILVEHQNGKKLLFLKLHIIDAMTLLLSQASGWLQKWHNSLRCVQLFPSWPACFL